MATTVRAKRRGWWNELLPGPDPMGTIAELGARGLSVHFLKGGAECTITKRSRVLWWGAARKNGRSGSASHDALIEAVHTMARDLSHIPERQGVIGC